MRTQETIAAAYDLSFILVEDDDGDEKAVRRAFRKAGIKNPILRVTDGVEALALLRGETGEAPVRYIILMDLNMPRMHGIELLREIRRDDKLNKAVVFVMTTSSDDRDQSDAYDLNVAGYILKGKIGANCEHLIKALDHYCRIVELPEIFA